MTWKTITVVVCLVVGTGSYAQSTVTLDLADVGPSVEGVFAADQLVPVEIFLRSDSLAPAFAIDLELNCATSDVSINSITVNPAFSRDLDGQGIELSDCHVRVRRSQPLTGFDASLGALDQPVLFATVELEVLNGEPFVADLEVSARVSLLGDRPGRYVILGQDVPATPLAADQPAAILQFVNGMLFGGESDGLAGEALPPMEAPPEVVTVQPADVSLEVRRVSDGQVVTQLVAGVSYELHYAAEESGPDGYAVFAVSDSATQGFSTATAAPSGPWSNTGWFYQADFDGLNDPYDAHGFPDGFYRNAMISDDIWPVPENPADPGAPTATGHLCNFAMAQPGQIALQLIMFRSGENDDPTVEMETVAQYTVRQPGGSILEAEGP